MIENATVVVPALLFHHGEFTFPSRLHEHGGDRKGVEDGYLEGTPVELKALQLSAPSPLTIKTEIEIIELHNVQYGEINEYGSVHILHLEWKSEKWYVLRKQANS